MPDLRLGRQCIPTTTPAYLQKVDSKRDKPREFFKSSLHADQFILARDED